MTLPPQPPALTGQRPLLPTRTAHEVIVPPPGVITLSSEMPAEELAEHQARLDLIRRLGLPTDLHELDDRLREFFDDIATRMATEAGFLYGMVNLFLGDQTFFGLHNPPEDSGHPIVGRTMSRRHGWCPEVVRRKKALPLHDVHASPRFSGNHVVDAIGIHAYFGAPLIHEESGIALGTVCIIDPEKRPLSDSRRYRDIVKSNGSATMKALTAAAPKH